MSDDLDAQLAENREKRQAAQQALRDSIAEGVELRKQKLRQIAERVATTADRVARSRP